MFFMAHTPSKIYSSKYLMLYEFTSHSVVNHVIPKKGGRKNNTKILKDFPFFVVSGCTKLETRLLCLLSDQIICFNRHDFLLHWNHHFANSIILSINMQDN